MMLDSTPRWFAPTDDYMSSVKLFAIMGLVGAFDPVLELVVFDRHKLRDLINPNRAMPASDPQKLLLAAVFGARNFFGWTRIIQGHPVYIA